MDKHIRKIGRKKKSTKKWKIGLDKQRGKKENPEREEESSHFSF